MVQNDDRQAAPAASPGRGASSTPDPQETDAAPVLPTMVRRPAALSETLVKNLARREAQRALADLGLDDAAARDDLADLRAALASGRRLRFGLLQQLLGWCVQGLMLLVALGVIMLAGGVG